LVDRGGQSHNLAASLSVAALSDRNKPAPKSAPGDDEDAANSLAVIRSIGFRFAIPVHLRRRQEFGMSVQVALFIGIFMVAFLLRVYIEYLDEK